MHSPRTTLLGCSPYQPGRRRKGSGDEKGPVKGSKSNLENGQHAPEQWFTLKSRAGSLMRQQPLSRLFSLEGGEENSSFTCNRRLEQKQQTDKGICLLKDCYLISSRSLPKHVGMGLRGRFGAKMISANRFLGRVWGCD